MAIVFTGISKLELEIKEYSSCAELKCVSDKLITLCNLLNKCAV